MIIPLTSRRAVPADADLLGALGRQLIEDEGHSSAMTVPELQQRMRVWLEGEYGAVIFKLRNEVVAYALFRDEPEQIYLRQFFVQRHCRRKGIGQEAMSVLRGLYWPAGKRMAVEVLSGNTAAIEFYKALGFRDYSVTLEIPAEEG
jgi:GNAT superfamily N-acetyltransferase